MKWYKELAAMRCFTHRDMVQLTGSENAAAWNIRNYLKKGYIERIRYGLYAVLSMETDMPIPNRFQIASRVSDDSFVSHHSALEFYGYANQVFYEVYFSTEKKIRPFYFDGLRYQPVFWRGNDDVKEMNHGVRVTSLERTVIDSIADFTKISGLEELLRCLALIPSLDESKLLEVLDRYGRTQLYQKVGYIFEEYKEAPQLSENFFSECMKRASSSKTYLCKKQDDFVFHRKWNLYAPGDLEKLVNKGVIDYAAV